MPNIPLFSDEVELYEDEHGMRVECQLDISIPITRALQDAGFSCAPPQVAIQGSPSAHAIIAIAIAVIGGSFEDMQAAVVACLRAGNVEIVEERFNQLGEKHTRLNMTNVNVRRR